MTIEQAIMYIIQNANDEQKQWASDVILGKKDIGQTTKSKDEFYFPTFHLGGNELPSRESLYNNQTNKELK